MNTTMQDQAAKLRQLAQQEKSDAGGLEMANGSSTASAVIDSEPDVVEKTSPAKNGNAKGSEQKEKLKKLNEEIRNTPVKSGLNDGKEAGEKKTVEKSSSLAAPVRAKVALPPQESKIKPDSSNKANPVAQPPASVADKEKQAGKKEEKTVDLVLPKSRFVLKRDTKVIAVTGGKGGVGKSNIASNLAIAFSQLNKKVLLMDADLSLANIDVLLGLTPRNNISHLISGEKKLEDVIINGPGGISILPGGSGVEELSNLPADRMNLLFEAFESLLPPPDVLLIDTAAGIHPNVLQFLMAADQVIVVTTPEPTAYVDAYALIKTLVKRVPDKEISILVNMAKDANEAMEVVRMMLELCRKMLNTGFNNLGFIPRDNDVRQAVRQQTPFLLRSPNCPAAKSLKSIAATILQIDTKRKSSGGLVGFFKRIFSGRTEEKIAASQ